MRRLVEYINSSLSQRMVGFKVKQESEPSNALIDKCSTFLQNGFVKNIL